MYIFSFVVLPVLFAGDFEALSEGSLSSVVSRKLAREYNADGTYKGMTGFVYVLNFEATFMRRLRLHDVPPSTTTPLHWACQAGFVPSVRLLACQADMALTPNADMLTPVAAAAGNGHLEALKCLLLEMPSVLGFPAQHLLTCVSTANNKGQTPLMLAAAGGHVECVRFLLELRTVQSLAVSVDARDHLGRGAVMYAAGGVSDERSAECVRMLIADGATDLRSSSSGATALLMATLGGNLLTVKELLKAPKFQVDSVLTSDLSGRSAYAVAFVGAHQQAEAGVEGEDATFDRILSAFKLAMTPTLAQRAENKGTLLLQQLQQHQGAANALQAPASAAAAAEGGSVDDVPPPPPIDSSLLSLSSRQASASVIFLEDLRAEGGAGAFDGHDHPPLQPHLVQLHVQRLDGSPAADMGGTEVSPPGSVSGHKQGGAVTPSADGSPTVVSVFGATGNSDDEAEGYDDDYMYEDDEVQGGTGGIDSHRLPESKEEEGTRGVSESKEGGFGALSGTGMGDDGDLPPPPAPLDLVRQTSSTVEGMGQEEVFEVQAITIRELAAMVKLPITTAGVLLRHHKFDVASAMDAYTTDPEGALKAAGTRLPSVDGLITSWLSGKKGEGAATEGGGDDEEECPVCLDDFAPSKLTDAGCGHRICLGCWRDYMKDAVQTEGRNVATTSHCPMSACQHRLDEVHWRSLAAPDVYIKYEQFLVRSFIALSSDFVWCPKDGCDRAIRYAGERSDILCPGCAYFFCRLCEQPAHAPCTCREASQWRTDKNSLQNAATRRLLMRDYKRCPGCSVYLQRSDGCNHMTCKCGAQWCYMCKGDWKDHGSSTGGYFKCNIHEKQKREKQHIYDWEDYTEEEKALLSQKENTQREALFNEARPVAARHEEGILSCERRLQDFKDEALALSHFDALHMAAQVSDVNVDDLLEQLTPHTAVMRASVQPEADWALASDTDNRHVFEFNSNKLTWSSPHKLEVKAAEESQHNCCMQVPFSPKFVGAELNVLRTHMGRGGHTRNFDVRIGVGSKSMHVRSEPAGKEEGSLGWSALTGRAYYGSDMALSVSGWPMGTDTQWNNSRNSVGIYVLYDRAFTPPVARGLALVKDNKQVARIPLRSEGTPLQLFLTISFQAKGAQVKVTPRSTLPQYIKAGVDDMLPNTVRMLKARARRTTQLNAGGSSLGSGGARSFRAARAQVSDALASTSLMGRSSAASVLAPDTSPSDTLAQLQHRVQLRRAGQRGGVLTAAQAELEDESSTAAGRWADVMRLSSASPIASASPTPAVASGAGDVEPPQSPPGGLVSPAPAAKANGGFALSAADIDDIYLGGGDEAMEHSKRTQQHALSVVTDALSALTDFHQFEMWLAVHVMYLGTTEMLSLSEQRQLAAAVTAANAAAAWEVGSVPQHVADLLKGVQGGAASGPSLLSVEQYKELLNFKLQQVEQYADSLFELTAPNKGLMRLDLTQLRSKSASLRRHIASLRQEVELESAILGEAPVIAQLNKRG